MALEGQRGTMETVGIDSGHIIDAETYKVPGIITLCNILMLASVGLYIEKRIGLRIANTYR